MPNKDSALRKINKYKRKIEYLEKKRQKRRRRYSRIVYTSSESENELELNLDDDLVTNRAEPESEPDVTDRSVVSEHVAHEHSPIAALLDESPASAPGANPESDAPATEPAPDSVSDAPASAPTTETDKVALTPNPDAANLPELDPELLRALGEETGNTPKFGEKIHTILAQRWEPILKKGLPKDIKEKLMKEYLVPENCTLLQAPKLNVEVAAAISETSRSRDKRKETDQQQLGVGISALNKAMTLLLTSDNKIEAIRLLSDGCKILTDLHYQETQSRISVINYALAKPFLNVVQDNERDETLYGVKLSEKIKASKVIEKQGLQIKKYTKSQKSSSTSEQTSNNTRPQYNPGQAATNQGNWSGPSRFQQNRGGRRGPLRRQPATTNRRPPPPQPATNAPGPAKSRAPARP